MANQLQSTAAAAERIFELIGEEEAVDIDAEPKYVIDADHVEGRVASRTRGNSATLRMRR